MLQDEYHMNPRAETDDAYKTTRMSALLASPRGIFGVTPSRDVEAFPRFWAIGSGASYAVGAMFTLFERTEDVEEIAQRRHRRGRGVRRRQRVAGGDA